MTYIHVHTEFGGGKQFTKLDLSRAYHQFLMDDDSKKFTTINYTQRLNVSI